MESVAPAAGKEETSDCFQVCCQPMAWADQCGTIQRAHDKKVDVNQELSHSDAVVRMRLARLRRVSRVRVAQPEHGIDLAVGKPGALAACFQL
ncbi:hypothetical protein ACFPAH_11210 [Massilia sp. GCM10023247]